MTRAVHDMLLTFICTPVEQDRTGLDRAEPGRIGPGRAGPGRADLVC